MSRVDGPLKILEKINDNAYKLELPPEFGISPTFNISDLRPYLGEEDEVPSRTTSIQEGEDDEDITTSDTTIPSYACPLMILRIGCYDLIVIRSQGVDHGEHTGHQEGAGEPRKHSQHGGSPGEFRIQESDFESNSESRTILPSN
jgi:hypothetical protein